MLHYAFPSFSIDETPRRGGLSRREIGHGALAEKSLAAALPGSEAWPFAVRLNAETMESNGSSSMAAVCAGSMALMDAGVPIAEHVGAISVGLVTETDEATGDVTKHALLADIMGLEDVLGDMDFKIAGTRGGVTGIQLDCKPAGIPLAILKEALGVAKRARGKVIDAMEAAIPRARRDDLGEIPENAPRFAALDIDASLIGKLIGTGGKTIKEIQTSTGATISVDQPSVPSVPENGVSIESLTVAPRGRVGIFAPNKKALDLAVERVGAIATPLAVGAVVDGDGDRREAVRLDLKNARFRRGHAARHGVPVGRETHRDVRLPSARRDGIGEGDRNRARGDKVFAQANHRAAGGVQASGKSPAA
jgi:polyribonucleotide nucleotidyltransferase